MIYYTDCIIDFRSRKQFLCCHIRRPGCHQLIQLRILREHIHKRHNGAATLHESTAGIHVGDIGKLVVRNVQQLGQFYPIRGCLVQHDEEFAVGQHGAGRMGLEQVVHILGQAGAAGPVLPYPLPEGEEEVGAVLMLEQQVG